VSTNTDGETILVSLIKLREGVDPQRFAEFASSLDLPVWRRKDVVLSFDTYRVAGRDRDRVNADFVEVMRLRSLEEWEAVGESDPDIEPLAAAFSELVDQEATQRIHLEQL
jgi:hypothetical protein